MYRPMTEQEKEAWDEREEMLARGLIKHQNRRASDLEANGSLTRSCEDE
jgi:hypothetical protein